MNKVAWITDLHFGIKKGSDEFLQSQLRYIKDQFIPTLKERNIKTVIFGGDLFEYRTHLNVKIKNAVLDMFQNDFKDFDVYILLGNHDIYFNTNVNTNSIKFLGLLPNVKIIDEITPIEFNGKNCLLVPWQVDDKHFVEYIASTTEKYEICFCHYPIKGFFLNKSKINDEGLDGDIFFNNFKLVISGHFHTRNTQQRNGSKILYSGCPWHLSRIDIGENKGGLILDLETLEYEFIDNSVSLKFVSIKYPEIPNKEMISGNIVDIHICYDENYNDEKIHSYIESIEAMSPINPPTIKIINNFSTVDISGQKMKNTYELMQDYISALNVSNGDEIYTMMKELFEEAKGEI